MAFFIMKAKFADKDNDKLCLETHGKKLHVALINRSGNPSEEPSVGLVELGKKQVAELRDALNEHLEEVGYDSKT